MKRDLITLNIVTSGPGINAYTLKADIEKTMLFRADVNSKPVTVEVHTISIEDTNELKLEGVIVPNE